MKSLGAFFAAAGAGIIAVSALFRMPEWFAPMCLPVFALAIIFGTYHTSFGKALRDLEDERKTRRRRSGFPFIFWR